MRNIKEDVYYIYIAEYDYLLICRIRDLRKAQNMTQLQLTQKMKLADGFVSKVETFTERAKYNIRHLPLLAKALGISVADLLPFSLPENDIVRLTYIRLNQINKDGSTSTKKVTKITKIEPVIKK